MTDSSPATDQASQAQFTVQKIYVKDVSFEAPNTPAIFNEAGQPALNMNLNQKVARLEDDVFEVVLGITLTCTIEEKNVYLAEIEQAGVFGLAGFDERNLDMMLGYAEGLRRRAENFAQQSSGAIMAEGGNA